MLWWVAGVLVVCLMLRLLADIWFPQPAARRNTQPVVDAANMRYVIANFFSFLESLLRCCC